MLMNRVKDREEIIRHQEAGGLSFVIWKAKPRLPARVPGRLWTTLLHSSSGRRVGKP